MSGFDAIELRWKGGVYTIRPHRVMGALLRFERSVTPDDFRLIATNGMAAAPSICSTAYGTLLRYANASVSDEEVYLACREEQWIGEQSAEVLDRLLDLQFLRLDPAERERIKGEIEAAAREIEETGPEPETEPEPENPTDTGPASSKARTKSRSGKDG